MIGKTILIGCYKNERVLTNSIFSSLKKFENKKYKGILSNEQKNAIKNFYKKKNYNTEQIQRSWGSFGVYFNVILNWQGQNMHWDHKSMHLGKCCYYFDARKLLIKVVNEIIDENIPLKNMIYFNNGYSCGRINSNTIIFEYTGDVENDVDIFLKTIKQNYRPYQRNHPNELIIKWLIPKKLKYGFIKKKGTNESGNNKCNLNQSNEVFNQEMYDRNPAYKANYNSYKNLENSPNLQELGSGLPDPNIGNMKRKPYSFLKKQRKSKLVSYEIMANNAEKRMWDERMWGKRMWGGYVKVNGVGRRKVRYYKNGNPYVIVNGTKKKI